MWCLADSCWKCVYDFQAYRDASLKKNLKGAKSGEAKTGYEVVMALIEGLYGNGHVVLIDNFFT